LSELRKIVKGEKTETARPREWSLLLEVNAIQAKEDFRRKGIAKNKRMQTREKLMLRKKIPFKNRSKRTP